jgi:hypothetical protein
VPTRPLDALLDMTGASDAAFPQMRFSVLLFRLVCSGVGT